MIRTAVLIAALLAATAACTTEPPRMERRILEDQVRVFTDRVLAEQRRSPDFAVRVLAENPDRTGGMYGSRPYRSAIEEDGRNLCSHMIAGVPPEQAHRAAYPAAYSTPGGPYDDNASTTVRYADELLCPLRPVEES